MDTLVADPFSVVADSGGRCIACSMIRLQLHGVSCRWEFLPFRFRGYRFLIFHEDLPATGCFSKQSFKVDELNGGLAIQAAGISKDPRFVCGRCIV